MKTIDTQNFVRIFLSYGLLKMVGMGLSIVYVLYLSSLLTANMLGVYYLTITIISLAMVISRLGLDMFIVKKVSKYIDDKRIAEIIGVLKYVNHKILSLSIILIFLLIASSKELAFLLLDDYSYNYSIIVVSAVLYFYNMVFIYSESFKAIGELNLSIVFQSILFPLINIIGVSIFFPLFGEIGVFISVSVTVTVMYILSHFLFYFKLNKKDGIFNNCSKRESHSIPYNFYLISLSNYVFASIDTLTLGLLADNSDVGIYNVLLRVVMPFSVLLIVINNIFMRNFSIWHSNGETEKCINMYAKLAKLSIVLGALFFVLIVYFRMEILLFFGQDYVAGVQALIILSIGSFVMLATGPSAAILMMTGHEDKYKKIVINAGLINVFLSVILIYQYGLIGAVISTSVSLIFKNTVSFYNARKYLGVRLL